MVENKIPNWKETRDRILSQGVKISELDAKIEAYKAKYGTFIGTDDLMYYMLAQKEYGLSMPNFTTLGQTGSVPVQMGLEEVGYNTAANTVSVIAYVADIKLVDGKKGDNIRATLMDGTAVRQMSCYFPEEVGNVLGVLTVGKTYQINGLGVFKREGRNGYPPDAQLTWNERTSAEEVQKNIFVNMREKPLKDGQPCMYEGYVTDEETRTYTGCSECKKSVKNGPCQKHPGGVAKEIGMYSATITDGTGKYTISFGSRPPTESLHHSVVQVVGVFNQQRNEIRVTRYQQLEKNAIPSHKDVVGGKAASVAPTQLSNGATVKVVTPEQVMISVVAKYGVSPLQAVLYKLGKDCGMTPEQASAYVEACVKEGMVTKSGEVVKWAR